MKNSFSYSFFNFYHDFSPPPWDLHFEVVIMHLNALKLKLSRKETPTWLSTCDDCGTNRSLRWLHIILDFRIKKWKNYNLHSVTMGYHLNYKTWENRRSVEKPHIWFILPNCVYNLNSQNIKRSCLNGLSSGCYSLN